MSIDIDHSYYMGFWEFDVLNSKSCWSDSLFELLELDKNEGVLEFDTFLNEIVHPDDKERFKKTDYDVLNTKLASRIDVQLKSGKNQYKWFKIVYQIDKKQEPEVSKIVRIFILIDDIKKTELSNVNKNRLLLETQKALNIGTWSVDLKKNEAIWSDEVYRIHEVPIGTKIELGEAINYYREDFRPVIGNAVQEAIRLQTRLEIDAVLVTTSGKEKWVQATFFPVKGASNEVEVIHGLFMDIDERKRGEINTKIQKETIELAAEAGGIGIWNWNIKTNELYWNEEMMALFAVPKDEFNGEYSDFSEKVHPEDLPSVEKNLKDTLEGKTETYNTTYRVVHPNGIVKNIDAKGVLIKDEIGQNERMIGTCIDITSRIEFEEFQEERAQKLLDVNELLEQEVQRRTEDLTQAIGDLETLTYSISHDLRAPLRAINGFAGIIAEEYQQAVSDTEFDRLLKFIQDNVHKMDERIRSILDYYKMGTGELELQPINLKLIFEEEFDHLSKSYHDLDIDFKVEELPEIKGDLMLLKQVIQNILDNAIKYSSKKKKSVIRVTFKECDTHYTFYVKDNGTGFDMQYVDKLFMVFQRLHHEKEYKGTGIGLSIAKRIIEMHNGTIKAESKLGNWTAISFTIPKMGS